MAGRGYLSVGVLGASLLAGASALAQSSDAPAPPASELRANEALILLDYQVVRVQGDKPIDLMGFHGAPGTGALLRVQVPP